MIVLLSQIKGYDKIGHRRAEMATVTAHRGGGRGEPGISNQLQQKTAGA